MIRHRAITAAGTALSWVAIPLYLAHAYRLGDVFVSAAVPMLDRTYEPPARSAHPPAP